ncbi:hypothetical protein MHPYR_140109 [uncultured Mycobacterium sp.]|uniref:Uncharacterized protein n=1 Tax=uncultured Mycobacterium sp. TaxID=171292 RepID=A0A1Y5P1X0_9MYCO|nr:hypothetical protein MHPYR_140109 [uncultured Mycobacterium sp.]
MAQPQSALTLVRQALSHLICVSPRSDRSVTGKGPAGKPSYRVGDEFMKPAALNPIAMRHGPQSPEFRGR